MTIIMEKKLRAALFGAILALLYLLSCYHFAQPAPLPNSIVLYPNGGSYVLSENSGSEPEQDNHAALSRPIAHSEPPARHTPAATPSLQYNTKSVADMTVVIARLKKANVSWATTELSGVNTAVYTVDDTSTNLTVPRNKGHEAMVYLTYIIDHYDRLPEVAVFIHSDRFTWHNNDLSDSDLVKMIKRLNRDWVRKEGYVNLRCHQEAGCDDPLQLNRTEDHLGRPEETVFKTVWADLHGSAPMPESLAHPCCAQWAVSRQTLQQYPREQYVNWRDWLLATDLSDTVSGRIWEYTWHYIFSGQPHLCLATHFCYCEGFSICFESYADSDNYWASRDAKWKVEDEYKAWAKEHNRTESPEANQMAITYESRLQVMVAEMDRRKLEAHLRGDDPEAKQKALMLVS